MATTAITKRNYERLEKRVKSANVRAATAKAQSRGAVRTMLHGVESVATGFALGYANGYYARGDGIEVFGMPLEVSVGLGATITAFFMDDDLSDHFHAIGVGAFTAWSSGLGLGAGMERAGKGAEATRAGALPKPPP